MLAMVPAGIVARIVRACSRPGNDRSSTYCAVPLAFACPSLRRTLRPTALRIPDYSYGASRPEGLRIALEAARPRDQSNAALERHVGPRPLGQHDNPVAESDQPEDVEEQPEHPGEPSRHPHPADVNNRRAPTDGGDV